MINDKTKREEFLIDDTHFKFNNSIDNFGIVYSTPTTIFNPTVNEFIINASGGNQGTVNSLNKNFGNGGCNTYDINNKRIKVCKDDGNGSTGISIPKSISNGLQDLSFRYYKYGSGGGGSIWKEGNNGGKGGIIRGGIVHLRHEGVYFGLAASAAAAARAACLAASSCLALSAAAFAAAIAAASATLAFSSAAVLAAASSASRLAAAC